MQRRREVWRAEWYGPRSAGSWRSGSDYLGLAAEQSLADELQVSKSTLRRALDVFVEQGILAKQPGKGNVLLRPPRRISRELVFLTSDPIFFAPALKSFCLRAVERNYYGTVVVLDGTAEMQHRLVHTVADRAPAGRQRFAHFPPAVLR